MLIIIKKINSILMLIYWLTLTYFWIYSLIISNKIFPDYFKDPYIIQNLWINHQIPLPMVTIFQILEIVGFILILLWIIHLIFSFNFYKKTKILKGKDIKKPKLKITLLFIHIITIIQLIILPLIIFKIINTFFPIYYWVLESIFQNRAMDIIFMIKWMSILIIWMYILFFIIIILILDKIYFNKDKIKNKNL